MLAIVLVKYDLSIERRQTYMKKILMFVVLLLGLACAGGGYYIFYLKPQQDAEAKQKKE